MIKIVIPTLGRINKQISYESLPDKYKKQVYFIVREEEYDFFNNKYDNVICLPSVLEKGITPTRQFIIEYFKNDIIYMIDDDLTFNIRNKEIINEKVKWKKINMNNNEEEFDKMFEMFLNDLNNDVYSVSLVHTSAKPNERNYPYTYNFRQHANIFIDLKKIDNINYDMNFICSQDFDFSLQLLSNGYKNKVYYNYFVSEKAYTKGGCQTYRTLQIYNDSTKLLLKKYPNVVKTKEVKTKIKGWNNEIQIKPKIYWKKCYNNYLKNKKNIVMKN